MLTAFDRAARCHRGIARGRDSSTERFNMRSLKRLFVSTLGAALIATTAFFALSASPAMASGHGCGIQLYNYRQCTFVVGSGLHISSVYGYISSSPSQSDIPNLHIEIYGPNGHIKNCSTFTLFQNTQGPTCTWSPNANERGGDYCTRTWQYNGGTNYSVLRSECVNVHS